MTNFGQAFCGAGNLCLQLVQLDWQEEEILSGLTLAVGLGYDAHMPISVQIIIHHIKLRPESIGLTPLTHGIKLLWVEPCHQSSQILPSSGSHLCLLMYSTDWPVHGHMRLRLYKMYVTLCRRMWIWCLNTFPLTVSRPSMSWIYALVSVSKRKRK